MVGINGGVKVIAVGDVVIAFVAENVNYQPASGVEVAVICWHSATAGSWSLYDGTQSAQISVGSQALYAATSVIRVFINNTVYIRTSATASAQYAYSGIQIK